MSRYLMTLGVLTLTCGCRFSSGDDDGSTPDPGLETPPAEATLPPWEDDPADDDLTIESILPSARSGDLPNAFPITVTFSEPYLGQPGAMFARLGPDCTAGSPLIPTLSADRTSASFNSVVQTNSEYCFSFTMATSNENAVSQSVELETATCGVSFHSGLALSFGSVGGDTQFASDLNDGLADYSFPLLMSFPDVARNTTFPVEADIHFARLFEVYDVDPGENASDPNDDTLVGTGQWSFDPLHGIAETLRNCQVLGDGSFECEIETLDLYVSRSNGKVLVDGILLTEGDIATLTLEEVRLVGTGSEEQNFQAVNNFSVQATVAHDTLEQMITWTGDDTLSQALSRSTPDADLDGDGEEDAYSIQISSSPIWVSLSGCDPTTY